MSLDGLRAWIGEVERKLGIRTRVFLVLTVIAVGGAGASIYLALDAQNDQVSEGDLQAVQDNLQAQIDSGTGEPAPATSNPEFEALQTQVSELQARIERLEKEAAGAGSSSGSSNREAETDGGTSSKAAADSETASESPTTGDTKKK